MRKLSKCCNAEVLIRHYDLGSNLTCMFCGNSVDEIDLKNKPKKCKSCLSWGEGKPYSYRCTSFDVCPYGNKQVSTNLNFYRPKNWWYRFLNAL